MPLAIRRHLLEGADDSEHRSATVAFLHFDGTDGIVERDGPAALAARLDETVRGVQRVVDEQEVTLLGSDIDHDGGKLILVSGVPRRVGDDEERMLTALRRIHEAELPLPLRIGAHTGPVFAGSVGPGYRRTFTVMGDTVNLAARVMSKAAPGQVLATPDVLDRSRRGFETEALEPFNVKGKKLPVTAFAVGAPMRSRRSGSDLLPLVGRDDELEVLGAELAAAANGDSRFAEIVGDGGMGKSRLVDELRARAAARPQPVQSIVIRCEAYESSAPYMPFWVLLRHLLGVGADESREAVTRRLEQSVGDRAPDLGAYLPLLGTTLDLDIDDTEETANLVPEYRRQRVGEVTVEFLSRLLAVPTMLVFEDVQHMDDSSVGLVHGLVARELPSLLLMVTRRDRRTGFVTDADRGHRIALGPLTIDEAADAVIRATEEAPLLPRAVRALAERAAGNPLFLDEMLRAISHDGDAETLPASIDAAVTAQIDRLSAPQRQILRRAAVLGSSFTKIELAEIVGPDLAESELAGPDEAVLEELGEFLVGDGPSGLRFRYEIMRDAAYEGLPFRQRRVLHGRAAAALEAALGVRRRLGGGAHIAALPARAAVRRGLAVRRRRGRTRGGRLRQYRGRGVLRAGARGRAPASRSRRRHGRDRLGAAR